MSKTVDLWLGPDIQERLERFIQGLIAETRSFGAREFAEQYYIISAPPSAMLTRYEDRDDLIRCCREGPRSVALYALQAQSAIGIGSVIFSAVGPDEQFQVIMLFGEEGDCVKWPTQEVELEQIAKTFGDSFHFPDWVFLSSLLIVPARN